MSDDSIFASGRPAVCIVIMQSQIYRKIYYYIVYNLYEMVKIGVNLL